MVLLPYILVLSIDSCIVFKLLKTKAVKRLLEGVNKNEQTFF